MKNVLVETNYSNGQYLLIYIAFLMSLHIHHFKHQFFITINPFLKTCLCSPAICFHITSPTSLSSGNKVGNKVGNYDP